MKRSSSAVWLAAVLPLLAGGSASAFAEEAEEPRQAESPAQTARELSHEIARREDRFALSDVKKRLGSIPERAEGAAVRLGKSYGLFLVPKPPSLEKSSFSVFKKNSSKQWEYWGTVDILSAVPKDKQWVRLNQDLYVISKSPIIKQGFSILMEDPRGVYAVMKRHGAVLNLDLQSLTVKGRTSFLNRDGKARYALFRVDGAAVEVAIKISAHRSRKYAITAGGLLAR